MIACRIAVFVFCAFILSLGISPAQGKSDGLLATPYPGSVVDPNRDLAGAPSRAVLDARSREFFSKDPGDKVKEFYKTLGEFHASPEGDHIQVCDVILFKDVVAIVEKKGGVVGEGGDNFWGGTSAGVTLHGKPTNNNFHYSVIKVYENLEQAYLKRFQNPDNPDLENMGKHLEDPELKKIEARYEHLKWAYYMQSIEKRKDAMAGKLSMDEVVYDKCYTAPEEARQKEIKQVQKKLTDASISMKFDEASKLGDRLMKLMQDDPKDQWGTAIKCLEEMDKHAYLTKIVIDTHPSKWDLTPPKN